MKTIKDSSGKIYQISDSGIAYHEETTEEVINVLERESHRGTRLIFDFGDSKSGKSWNEEFDTRGTIGKSTGSIKIPLLIKTSRSFGGGVLLDHCIIKITDSKTKAVLYKHSNYHN